MTAFADRLRVRLFIEGIEVPVIAAQIQTAPNSPAVASIQVPPLAEGTRLMPRSLVHLYFLDFYATASPALDAGKKAAEDKNSPTDHEDEEAPHFLPVDGEPVNRNYKLMFVGEVVGFIWTKAVRNRSLILQCEDPSNYWDYAYQYENSDIFGPGVNALFSGGATNLFTDFLSSKGSTLTQIVASGQCNSFPNLKGLSAGIIRLVEAIGGTYFPAPGSGSKKIAGQNIFFSLAELRLHLTGMIAAYDNDPTSQNILAKNGYSGMFDRALGGMGGQTSIRQAISALTKIMFHETYAQPCPMYIPGSNGEVSGVKRTKIKDHPIWGFITDEAEKAIFGVEDIRSSVVTSSFAAKPDATAQGVLAKRIQNVKSALQGTMTRMRANSKSKPPDTARTVFSTAANALGIAASKIGAKTDAQRAEVLKKLDEALAQLRRCVDLTFIESASKDIAPARLVQQILRPDIWFGSPPRCNVIFPEHYDNITYQRMFLQEPTRFLLKTNDEFFGEDFLFDKLYFAPQAGTARGDRARLSSVLGRDLLDHELFTGILPVFEKMGEFNVFAAKSGAATGPLAKIGLAQRSANFLYFKHRFAARKMVISGKFNPYIAVGFPGLVFDKYIDPGTIATYNEQRRQANIPEIKISELLGTNFLANFTQVMHSVNQAEAGGRTEITCTFARQPDEGVEFLGTIPEDAKVQKKVGEAIRATDIAAVSPPKVFGFGPNLGRIISVEDVSPIYIEGERKLPLFDVGAQAEKKDRPATLVPIGVQTSAEELGSSVVLQITGDLARPVIFRAYRVTEEVPRYQREDVLLPAEEYIRPGWYGDCWSPSKIGEVYNAFFNIGSITEATTVFGPGGSSLSQSSEAADEAAAEQDNATNMSDPAAFAAANLSLEEGSSIQEAVEFLLLTYSFMRQQENIDIREFIRSYTWRPIATLVDMFGTSDLEFSVNGETAVTGVEGFHSRAFGPREDLFGLAGPDVEDILGIRRGTTAAQRADTRKRKYDAVVQFVSVLQYSRAILG